MMPSTTKAHDAYRIRRAVDSGQTSQILNTVEQLIHDLNTLRDNGAPEDILEHYTSALAGLNQARRSVALASTALWKRTEP